MQEDIFRVWSFAGQTSKAISFRPVEPIDRDGNKLIHIFWRWPKDRPQAQNPNNLQASIALRCQNSDLVALFRDGGQVLPQHANMQ
jgi:hypothetical protein